MGKLSTIPSQLRIATISAMSERLARECASEAWPDEKIVSSKKKSRNLKRVLEERPMSQIPKVIHYVWVGNKRMPDEQVEWMERAKSLHADWAFKVWNNDDIKNFSLENMIRRSNQPAQKADIMRMEIMHRYGGIYLDTDTEVLKSFDPLLGAEAFIAAQNDKTGYLAISPLGSIPGGSFFGRVVQLLPKRKVNGDIVNQTGPGFITQVHKREPSLPIVVHQRMKFFPYMWSEGRPVNYPECSFCSHHWRKSWR